MSLADGGMGMGHYKGVMLCNRPFAGTMANTKTTTNSESKGVFSCGKVPEAPGLNPPVSLREKAPKRNVKDSVLTKHKKWLQDLQKARDELEERVRDEARQKEEATQRFKENERMKRELARSLNQAKSDSKDSDNDKPEVDSKYNEVKSESKSNKLNRPAWALTEDIAEKKKEHNDELEEDELLNFVEDLDYDNIIDELEIKAVIGRLKERITSLEQEIMSDNKNEESKQNDASNRARQRELLELMTKAEKCLSEAPNGESEVLSAARALLEEEQDFQAIHSKQSMMSMILKAKEKINSVSTSVKPNPVLTEPTVYNEPKIVVHEASEGSRLENKKSISKLPYMNRNPAI